MQFAHFRVAFVGVFHRVMRMYAGGGEQLARTCLRKQQRLRRMFATGAGDDHLRHARGPRALQHGLAVVVEAVVRKVGADVDQSHS